MKNLLDFSDDYARSTARSHFWYLDTAETVVLNNNSGIKAREGLIQDPKTVETIIPLNRYSFFEDLQDKILPPVQMEFNVTFQNDAELVWQNDNNARRVVVTKQL